MGTKRMRGVPALRRGQKRLEDVEGVVPDVSCCRMGGNLLQWRHANRDVGPEEEGWCLLLEMRWIRVNHCPWCNRRITPPPKIDGIGVPLTDFGKALERLRLRLDLTQEEVARRAGMTQPALSQNIRSVTIRWSVMVRLMAVLGYRIRLIYEKIPAKGDEEK